MATLKDIGAELGLSPATVSRALNGFPEVSARTRERVRETAERLGYRPNRVAQRLVTGRSGMVGMIVRIRPDMSADQTFFEVVAGLSAELAARDTDLVLAVDRGDDPVAAYRRMLERDILDGFILNAPIPDDPRVAFLRAARVPFVMHGQTAPEVDYPFYGIDNRAVAADAVEFLHALGHRRIAFLNAHPRLAFARDRAEGFRTAIATLGLAIPDVFRCAVPPAEGAGYAPVLRWLSGRAGPRPTAIVCSSTPLAADALRAASDLGLAVPETLSILAHDDGLPGLRSEAFSPPLTVTLAPFRDACAPLAEALIAHIRGAPVNEVQRCDRADLIVRGSTGPVPPDERAPWSFGSGLTAPSVT